MNRLRENAGAKIDAWTMAANVYDVKTRGPNGPAFGDLAPATVTSDDVAVVMGAQPAAHRAETRIKQYNRLHRLFELAEFPCRLRPEGSNPVKKYLRAEMDAEKLFCFLYPSELLALLHCKDIPLGRRVLYAIATYTGQRKGSLFALRWKHTDFDHGTLTSFRTKSGKAQHFVADPGLMAILEGWRAFKREPEPDAPLVLEGEIEVKGGPKRVAGVLRADFKKAKVTVSVGISPRNVVSTQVGASRGIHPRSRFARDRTDRRRRPRARRGRTERIGAWARPPTAAATNLSRS